jgi:hypothetical protein
MSTKNAVIDRLATFVAQRVPVEDDVDEKDVSALREGFFKQVRGLITTSGAKADGVSALVGLFDAFERAEGNADGHSMEGLGCYDVTDGMLRSIISFDALCVDCCRRLVNMMPDSPLLQALLDTAAHMCSNKEYFQGLSNVSRLNWRISAVESLTRCICERFREPLKSFGNVTRGLEMFTWNDNSQFDETVLQFIDPGLKSHIDAESVSCPMMVDIPDLGPICASSAQTPISNIQNRSRSILNETFWDKFGNCIVQAGGSVFDAVYGRNNPHADIDLFFYGLHGEEGQKIAANTLENAIVHITERVSEMNAELSQEDDTRFGYYVMLDVTQNSYNVTIVRDIIDEGNIDFLTITEKLEIQVLALPAAHGEPSSDFRVGGTHLQKIVLGYSVDVLRNRVERGGMARRREQCGIRL